MGLELGRTNAGSVLSVDGAEEVFIFVVAVRVGSVGENQSLSVGIVHGLWEYFYGWSVVRVFLAVGAGESKQTGRCGILPQGFVSA